MEPRTHHRPHHSLYNCVPRVPGIFSHCLTPEDGNDRSFQNVCKYQSTLCNIPEECRSHIYRGVILKTNQSRLFFPKWARIFIRKNTKFYSTFLFTEFVYLHFIHGYLFYTENYSYKAFHVAHIIQGYSYVPPGFPNSTAQQQRQTRQKGAYQ